MKTIISCLSKLLAETITNEELIEFYELLKDKDNQAILEAYVRDQHDLNLATIKNNVNEAYRKVMNQIENGEKPARVLLPNWIKYAAAVLVLLGISYFYQQDYLTPQSSTILVPKDESITLELDNGKIEIIDISQIKEVKGSEGNLIGNQKENRLSYTSVASTQQLVYNTLKVPYGKRFELVLSDGTTVHLNGGTILRYPVAFLENHNRHVYLEGEAYFDVSKDRTRPFIVNTEELNIKVLGTEFNVSSYRDDNATDVVLVEGSVSLSIYDVAQIVPVTLEPGQMGALDHSSQKIDVGMVNTDTYTAWMQGNLVFRDLTFDNILRKLERHYNIKIENRNAALGREVFDASFNNIKIDSILSFFGDTHEINYTIENNKVFIE